MIVTYCHSSLITDVNIDCDVIHDQFYLDAYSGSFVERVVLFYVC